jgi:CHASE3 domain sensor protein
VTTRFRPRTLRWRVYTLVGVVLALLLGTVLATVVARRHAAGISGHLRGDLRPAQVAMATMTKGYLDMETGLRGFLLTRDRQVLTPYDSGRRAAADASELIGRRLAGDPTSLRLLSDVDDAGTAWENVSATPLIDAARDGTLTTEAQTGAAMSSKQLFDDVRGRLSVLESHIEQLIATGLQSYNDAQSTADLITILCAAAALVVGVVIVLLVHTSLVRPVNRLVATVGRASAGDLEHRVTASGPTEVVALGEAVESMRERIVAESALASASSARLGRLEEADRIAQDLEQTAIRDLFALSLSLQSVAGRNPAVRPELNGIIRDLDRSLLEMRSAVLGRMTTTGTRKLRAEVLDLLVLLEQDLAITPELSLEGDHELALPTPLATDVLSALHDAVFATTGAGTSKEVKIHIALSATEVRLRVAGTVADQAGAAARETTADLADRAHRYGGDAAIEEDAGRLAVQWWVPVAPEQAERPRG